MEPFKAVTFYNIGRLLRILGHVHGTASRPGSGFYGEASGDASLLDVAITEGSEHDLNLMIGSVLIKCQSINLQRSSQYSQHILDQIKENKLTNRQVANLISELDKHIRWDMDVEMFMYVPKSRSKYYGMEKPLGPEVDDAFPSARFDLKQAGNSLACGIYTASGMHLMRAAEVALWELARDRQTSLAQAGKVEFSEWGTIIRELEEEVKKIQQWPNSPSKEDAHKFYNRALVEIRSFNDGIRRHLAHVRPNQLAMEADEALANWGHVSRFMKTLAGKIGEGKYMPLIWP